MSTQTDIPDPRDPEALVRQFHEVYGLPVVTSGPQVDNERMHMRLSLILEETSELVRALYGESAYQRLEGAIQCLREVDEGAFGLRHLRDGAGSRNIAAGGVGRSAGFESVETGGRRETHLSRRRQSYERTRFLSPQCVSRFGTTPGRIPAGQARGIVACVE